MAQRDQRPGNVRYYTQNSSREVARVRRRQAQTRDYLRALRQVPCADCGRTFQPHQMDFDHREPESKSFRLTEGRAMLMSRSRLATEASKCDVVCANCHRVRTYRRAAAGGRAEQASDPSAELRRKRAYWRAQARSLERLERQPCADCGQRFPSHAMDFDHRDPRTKRYTISRMIGRTGTARIMAEVAKCDIVCANCHRDRTLRRREAGSPERE